jgi:hypothetical protein
MTEFKVGDQVRVFSLPRTLAYAGRTGEVIRVSDTPNGAANACRVKLDGSLRGDPCSVTFLQSELEPEAGGTS